MDHTLFLALPARNLAKAQEAGPDDLAIPCAACYSRLAAADLALQRDEDFRTSIQETLGFKYEGRIRPRSLLDIFANDVPRSKLAGKVSKPLDGLKVVSYYGCLLIRPPEYTGRWDDPEHPQSMDYVMELMGAQPVPWSYGVDCCGGSLTLNRSDVVVHLVDKLARAAHEAGADAMVTACPMCMANVDGRQLYREGPPIPRPEKPDYEPMPIFYFTELMALAYDLPLGKVLGRHLVNPKPLLKKRGLI
jgi:heterodisulfide reductase subunit B